MTPTTAGIRQQFARVVILVGVALLVAHISVDMLLVRRHTGPDTISSARMATQRLALAVERLLNAGAVPDPMFREFVELTPNIGGVALVDDRGIVVGASDERWRGEPVAGTAIARDQPDIATTFASDSLRVTPLRDHRALGVSTVRAAQGTFHLLLLFDHGAAYAEAMREALFEALWIVLFSGLVLGALWLLLETRVLRPAFAIAQAAERLGQGDLSARSGVSGRDEIRRAGEAFDRMAGRIEATETELARTRALFDAVLRALPVAIIAVSRTDRRLLLANPRASEMAGFPLEPDQSVGDRLDRVNFEHLDGSPCPPEERPIATVIRSGRPAEFEDLVYVLEDGTRIPVYVAAAPVVTSPGAPFDAVVAVIQDRRELQRRIDELRDWGERFQTVATATGQIVYEWNIATGESRRSGSLVAVLGYSASSFPDRIEEWENRLHPEDLARVKTEMASCRDERRMFDCEYRLRHADGRWRVIRDRAFFSYGPAGQAIAMVGSMADITDHRDLERQLAHAQKMETVGTLAGGVAHDFNNQLTGVMGHLDLLARELGEVDPRQEHVRLALRAAERCADLTRGLLAFSRRLASHPEPTLLNDTVAETAALLHRTLPSRVRLKTELESDAWTALADPGQIQQVLMNLCVNARDAMPDGGTLTIWTRNLAIHEHARRTHPEARTGEFVEIGVSDTGGGIAPDVIPRIFEPFFTTKSVGVGTGLGLSMAYGIVSNHHGWIEVESAVGRGATFRVMLPRSVERVRPARRKADQPQGGSETVLVVDDEEVVRQLAARTLASAGYRVMVARHGDEAIEMVRAHPADIRAVLLDLSMPGRSGLEVQAILREISPEMRIILSSGFSAESLESPEAMTGGAAAFLPKPYGAKALLQTMRQVLDGAGPGAPFA
jgi:signal transduction histidine kinase/ActR/RegA family two-component response regulator/HAMP domain-containing protein